MQTDFLRQVITAMPRAELPRAAKLLWRAYASGEVSDADAAELSNLIERQKAPQRSLPRPKVGSRPRTPESLLRRRRWTAAGRLPPQIACQFTMGETAVLALVAAEVAKRGDCRLTISNLAAVAGVSVSTARNALRTARLLGLLTSELRRVARWRNDSNIIRIISPEWRTWLRLQGRKPEGVIFQRARIPDNKKASNWSYSKAAMAGRMETIADGREFRSMGIGAELNYPASPTPPTCRINNG